MVEQVVHFRLALAHGQAADGEAVEIQGADFLHRATTQILEKTALGDAEKQIGARARRIGGARPRGPAGGQGQGGFRIGVVRAVGHALVQHHHDVGIEIALDGNDFFRGEQMARAVQMRTELHALLADFAQGAQAEDLKAAAVREHGSGPGGEAVQAAVPGHQLVAGPQIKVIGIAQNDGRADGRQIVGRNGLDRAHRAHGHEDGRGDDAVGRAQQPGAGRAVRVLQCKNGFRHGAQPIRKRAALQGPPDSGADGPLRSRQRVHITIVTG